MPISTVRRKHRKHRKHRRHTRRRAYAGFTLLELLVAIAVFAVLGVMSSQLLSNIIRQHDIIETRGQRLADLQRAMNILQRDLGQIARRGVRDNYGDPLLPLVVGAERPLELTRYGWRNPLGHARADLQRVAYAVSDSKLYRYYWSVLDRSPDTEPIEQVLLDDVYNVEFTALDGNGDDWPQPGLNPEDPLQRLVALSVRFELETYGEITRLWEVPDVTLPIGGASNRASGEESGDPGDEDDGEFDDDLDDDESLLDRGNRRRQPRRGRNQ